MNEVYDPVRKTFFGRITNENEKYGETPLSAVFITRIMWTFAASYRIFPNVKYKKMADEAFRILLENFWDNENGGIYWSVLPNGKKLDTKKQFYAQAFFIYALSEYYLAFQSEKAKQIAVSMFLLIEKYAWDIEFGGYVEACTVNWSEIKDQRLSLRDLNVKKSMNTHLHLLEAYTNFYRVYKNQLVKKQLKNLVHIFLERIIDRKTGHLNLYFDTDWKVHSGIVSYGHDIEYTWLLNKAVEVLGEKELIGAVESIVMKSAEIIAKEGVAKHGGLYYEKKGEKLMEQFHWWPQAEAVVGFFSAWQISKNKNYLQLSLNGWEFIQQNIIDKKNAEWFLGVDKNLEPLHIDKINEWKAPYHNSRMCLEMICRISSLVD